MVVLRLVGCVALFLALFAPSGVAQDGGVDSSGGSRNLGIDATPSGVVVLAKSFGDSVVLRWGPTTPAGWLDGNRFGYVVERIRIHEQSVEGEVVAEPLTPGPLLPWTPEEWEAKIGGDTTQIWMAVAYQSLHGESTSAAELGASENTYRAGSLRAIELANRHGFALFAADQDADAARGLAVRLTDRDVVPNGRYAYRVYIAGLDTAISSRHDTGYAVVNMADEPFNPTPVAVHAVGYDGAIRVGWKDDPLAGFSGYWVEREENGSWRRLNRMPIVLVDREQEVAILEPSDSLASQVDQQQGGDRMLSFVDSSITNYQTYRYRVIGVDPFADLSEAVEVEGSGRDMTGLPPPTNLVSEEVGEGQVRISWEMVERSNDLAGFLVARGPTESGPFRTVTETPLAATARDYLVEDANEEEAYYSIIAIDTADNRTPSLVLLAEAIDRQPPSAPTGLQGRVDSSGAVILTWNNNPETDINGYKVFFLERSRLRVLCAHQFPSSRHGLLRFTQDSERIEEDLLQGDGTRPPSQSVSLLRNP